MILSLILTAIFFTLGIIHFYWSLGGELGINKTIPTKENDKAILNPRKRDTAVVGMGLVAFGVFYIMKSGVIELNMSEWILKYGSWIISLIFILRAIGEFNYVGFFKKVKRTEFGKMDTKFFSPLCLIIGILGIAIALIK
ncbi:MAG: DUF3995 domain-containing protein [Cyclobacteriaceae bacterium]